MAFEVFPYSNLHDLNLDWVMQQVKTVSEYQGSFDRQITALSQQIVTIQNQINVEMQRFQNAVNASINAQTQTLASFQVQLEVHTAAIAELEQALHDSVIGLQQFVLLNIAENNVRLKDELSQDIRNFTVVNPFDGTSVTVQQMFDTLAQLHMTDALTYSQLTGKGKTYAQLSALQITYYNLINHGASLVN